jgi:outer membrane protein assembly factor BamE
VLTTATSLLFKLRTGAAVGALAIVLSACGGTKWGFPYKTDMQQGNWITSEQVARLEKGMTREQVRFVLGTPVLQDIFRTNRWDYTYYNKPGYGKVEERKFTVWFKGDVLDHWEGDQQPDRQPFQKTDNGAKPAPSSSDTDSAKEQAASTVESTTATSAPAAEAAAPNAAGTTTETHAVPSSETSSDASRDKAASSSTLSGDGTGFRINAPGSDTLTLPNESSPQPLR